MTSRPPPVDEHRAHIRHYPLDMDLPFERYEHRHLAARDILVQRIMSKFLFPSSKELAQVYETHRSKENGLQNFGLIKRYDRALAWDLELLRKMLVTCSTTEDFYEPFVKPLRFTEHGFRLPSFTILDVASRDHGRDRVTLAEEILDLARRHYLEADDPSMRIWLHAIQPPVGSLYNTLPRLPQAEKTHLASVQERKRHSEMNRRRDEKKWYIDDTQYMQHLQRDIRNTGTLDLYDGGALLPPLREPLLSSRASRMRYLEIRAKLGVDFILQPEEHWEDVKDSIYPWPEADTPRRVLNFPSWRAWRQKQRWFRDIGFSPPVDFASGRTGRGMDRDGIWATARWKDEDEERGRAGRRGRRRASSEPPPDIFTSARLPWCFNHPREMLIFPKMTTATLDRRSRRRSLSRTRIAEMFDWNTVLAVQDPPQKQPGEELSHVPPSGDTPTCAHELELRLHKMRHLWPHDYDAGDVDGLFDNILVTLQRKTVPALSCCRSTGAGSCANCSSTGHATSKCQRPCGYCGAPSPETLYPGGSKINYPRRIFLKFGNYEWPELSRHGNMHTASACPVAKQNRCKCGPFPQYHVATKCSVVCTRKCGNVHPPGHFKHKNAMTCRARCCMCGIKGHSGQQCKLKRCRCGGAHLGQDCRWQVECRVMGCDKFLCGMHCAGCGISRGELQEGSCFSGGRCPSCLSKTDNAATIDVNEEDDENASHQGEENHENQETHNTQHGTKRGRRKNIRKTRHPVGTKKEKEELPWYAPLQPRTRPIVTSKSGKRMTISKGK